MGRLESERVRTARAALADPTTDIVTREMCQAIVERADYLKQYNKRQRDQGKDSIKRVQELETEVRLLNASLDESDRQHDHFARLYMKYRDETIPNLERDVRRLTLERNELASMIDQLRLEIVDKDQLADQLSKELDTMTQAYQNELLKKIPNAKPLNIIQINDRDEKERPAKRQAVRKSKRKL